MKRIHLLALITLLLSLVSLPIKADVYSNLAQQVNNLTTSSPFATVVSVDKDVTAAIAADLITEEQFETLDSKIRTIYRTSTVFDHYQYASMPNDPAHRIRNKDCVLMWSTECSISGTIEIPDGVTVVFVSLDEANGSTLKRNSALWNAPMIKVNGTLIIKGAHGKPFIIDGGAVISNGNYQNGEELSSCTMTTSVSDRLIYIDAESSQPDFRATNAVFQNNYAAMPGSGITVNCNGGNAKTMFFYNASFFNIWSNSNTDGPSVGSAIFTNLARFVERTLPDGTKDNGILLNHCHFKGNLNTNNKRAGENARLQNGGAAFGTQSGHFNLRMKNSLLESNYSPWHGGAIFWNISVDGELDLQNNTFERNCGGLGAAVYVQGNLALKDCTFKENKAVIQNKNNPGYQHPAYQAGNGYDGCGGALYIQPSSAAEQDANCNLKLDGCTFEANEADLDGGAILIYTTYNASEPSKRDIHMSLEIGGNTVIKNNKAGRLGGGVAQTISNELFSRLTEYNIISSVEMKNGKLSGNEVLGTFTNDRATFQGTGFGGALFVDEAPLLKISNGFKVLNNTSKKDGGAFYVGHGNVQIIDAEIKGNTALEGNGGAVRVDGGDVIMSGGIVSGNDASMNGGAIYVKGNIEYNYGQISENEAGNCGGGVYIENGMVSFNNGILKLNKALNGGGIFLASGASMTFTDGLIAQNHALMNDNVITTAYNAKSAVSDVNGCGGGIYLQSGASAAMKTALTINVVNGFGLYGNTADRAGDDIVAEGVNTSVTVPNVTAMDLKDFEGKDAQPNWYEDYVYVQDGSDSGYAEHSILKYSGGSGKRFQQMLMDGSGDIYNHLVTFDDDSRTFPTSAGNDGYVCLTLGYTVLSAIIRATGLNEKESMYFTLEQLVKSEGPSDWTVKNTYPVLVTGNGDGPVERTVRNLMPGYYRVKQFQSGATPWAWAYTVTDPSAGVIQKKVTKEDNLFPFTVKHVEGGTNVLHDEEYKVNEMLMEK